MQTTDSTAPHMGASTPSLDPNDVPAAASLGNQLERDRLEQRVARVRLVIGALRERADARHGDTPPPLQAAIEGFGRELADLERQLRRAGSRR